MLGWKVIRNKEKEEEKREDCQAGMTFARHVSSEKRSFSLPCRANSDESVRSCQSGSVESNIAVLFLRAAELLLCRQ